MNEGRREGLDRLRCKRMQRRSAAGCPSAVRTAAPLDRNSWEAMQANNGQHTANLRMEGLALQPRIRLPNGDDVRLAADIDSLI